MCLSDAVAAQADMRRRETAHIRNARRREPGCFAPQRHQSVTLAQQTEPVNRKAWCEWVFRSAGCWTGFVISLVG